MRRGRLYASATAAIACLVGFWELGTDFAYESEVQRFDAVVSAAIVSLRTPWLTWVMKLVTVTGGGVVVTAAVFALVTWQMVRRRRVAALFSVVLVAGGSLIAAIAKGQFVRLRPPAESALIALPQSYSFPSGHAMASLCLGAALAYSILHSAASRLVKRASVIACLVYPVAVGLSRVYLGVHFASDVVASWLLGGVLLSLSLGAASLSQSAD
ncbi:MAG: phosphatase PAP2 family protein [Actinobacteria bacterium HGW-Actinobacteria-7]|nr:MAG: phosphatase PAP2 family protein [Actinobacteria bacterium HGW-Actinobacteria-7]